MCVEFAADQLSVTVVGTFVAPLPGVGFVGADGAVGVLSCRPIVWAAATFEYGRRAGAVECVNAIVVNSPRRESAVAVPRSRRSQVARSDRRSLHPSCARRDTRFRSSRCRTTTARWCHLGRLRWLAAADSPDGALGFPSVVVVDPPGRSTAIQRCRQHRVFP